MTENAIYGTNLEFDKDGGDPQKVRLIYRDLLSFATCVKMLLVVVLSLGAPSSSAYYRDGDLSLGTHASCKIFVEFHGFGNVVS